MRKVLTLAFVGVFIVLFSNIVLAQENQVYPRYLQSVERLESVLEKFKDYKKYPTFYQRFVVTVESGTNQLKEFNFKSDTDTSWMSDHVFITFSLNKLAETGYEEWMFNNELRSLFLELQNAVNQVSVEASNVFTENYNRCKERSNNEGKDCLQPFNKERAGSVSVGFNTTNAVLSAPLVLSPPRNGYLMNGWEIQVKKGSVLTGYRIYSIEVYTISDKNDELIKTGNIPDSSELKRVVANNWVQSGRGVSFQVMDYFDNPKRRLSMDAVMGGGIWIRHEALRLGPPDKRDRYRIGITLSVGPGVRYNLTKKFTAFARGEMKIDIWSDMQVRYKLGAFYNF